MAIETRAILDAASLVVKNETGIAQNSANRVGSLFENLSDSAVLLAERGCVSLSTKNPFSFTPAAADTAEKLPYPMADVVSTAYNVSHDGTPSVAWNGDAGIVYRVSVLINCTATNGREFYFYIAKDGVIDETTKVSIHFHSSDPRSVSTELFASGAHSYEIWIEQKGTVSQIDFVNAQLNLMSV